MTKFRYFNVVIALSLAFTATAMASTVRYFRIAEIMDARHQFRFRNELHGTDTAICNCYRVTYDDQGRLTEWAYLSAGQLEQDPQFEVARATATYDGAFTTYRFFERHGRRDDLANGHYGEKFKLDANSKTGGLYPYDEHDYLEQPDKDGVYRYNWILNDKGYVVEEMYMNQGGTRLTDNDSVYDRKFIYDDSGRLTEEDRFGQDGKPVTTGWASEKRTLNDQGLEATLVFLNAKGEPIQDSGWAAKVESGYDEWGYENSRTLYDAFGGIIWMKKWTQDARGNVLNQTMYGPDESLVAHDPILDYSYDTRNVRTDIYRRDRSGRLRVHVHFKQNDHGDPIEESYSDSTGKPIVDDDSYSTIKQEYDNDGHLLTVEYLGADGNPIGREEDTVAFVYRKYNSAGLVTEIRSLDANKNLHMNDDYDSALINIAYNSDGEISEVHRFDQNNKEIMPDSGR